LSYGFISHIKQSSLQLRVAVLPLPSRLEWVKNPAKHTLQPGNKPLLTQRSAGALMPTYQNSLRVRHAGLKQRPPIVHKSPQWSNLYQSIINPFHMRRRTAPWVQLRLLDKSSGDDGFRLAPLPILRGLLYGPNAKALQQGENAANYQDPEGKEEKGPGSIKGSDGRVAE
jgi:hypothetical protein